MTCLVHVIDMSGTVIWIKHQHGHAGQIKVNIWDTMYTYAFKMITLDANYTGILYIYIIYIPHASDVMICHIYIPRTGDDLSIFISHRYKVGVMWS